MVCGSGPLRRAVSRPWPHARGLRRPAISYDRCGFAPLGNPLQIGQPMGTPNTKEAALASKRDSDAMARRTLAQTHGNIRGFSWPARSLLWSRA